MLEKSLVLGVWLLLFTLRYAMKARSIPWQAGYTRKEFGQLANTGILLALERREALLILLCIFLAIGYLASPVPATMWAAPASFLYVLGLVMSGFARRQFASWVNQGNTESLLTTGIYKWTRHPIYIAKMLQYSAFLLLVAADLGRLDFTDAGIFVRLYGLVGCLTFLPLTLSAFSYRRLALFEEEVLKLRYGSDYRYYQERTIRF